MTVSDLFIFHQFSSSNNLLEIHPAALQNYCLTRLFMWNYLSQILYYYMEKKA